MISQVEQFVKQGRYEQALELLPLMEQVFADNNELRHAVHVLELHLSSHSDESLATLQNLKEVLVR